MFVQSKKLQPWKKKNYISSILQFFLHAIIVIGIIVGLLAINATKDGGSFGEYWTVKENVQKFMFIVLATLFLFTIIYLYFYFEFRDFMIRPKNIAVIFVVIEFSLIICLITSRFIPSDYSIYARPFALCSLLILLLVNRRTAVYVNFCFSLLLFIADVFGNHTYNNQMLPLSSLIIGCASGMVGIYLVDEVGSRIKVFSRGFFIAIPIIICAVSLEFYFGVDFSKIVPLILYGFMSGITSVVYMMAIIPVFEWLFNVLTNYRLAEVTDHKSKLIEKLAREAPGTFNHSLTVATLAESCAAAIGENALLARACAYYHDIGKLNQPGYFTENQYGVNPHDELTPELSTEIIRSHATDGYELIKKYHLPMILADVAREHHGTLPIQYFFMKAKKYTDGDLDISDFCYKGPKPHTKIAAIIMLVDGCEAAVRAISTSRTHEEVEKVIRSIFEDRINRDQFSECEITMLDLEIIKKTIQDNLSGVYHERINYPKIQYGKVSSFSDGAVDEPKEKQPKKTKK